MTWLRSGLALLVAVCMGAVLAVLVMRIAADEANAVATKTTETPPPLASPDETPSPAAHPSLTSPPSLTLNSEAQGCVPQGLPAGAFVDLYLDDEGRVARIEPGPGVEELTTLCLTQKLEGVELGAPGGKSTHRVPLTTLPSGEGEHAGS